MTEPNPNLDLHPDGESWKSEIASRLDSYRHRSRRKLSGDFSMRFDFEGAPVGPRQQICMPMSGMAEAAEVPELTLEISGENLVNANVTAQELSVVELEGTEEKSSSEPQAASEERPKLRPSFPFKRKIFLEPNVIEFPRLFPPEPPSSCVIAEPVLPSVPRILDAPEIAEPLLETPILDGMRLEPVAAQPTQGFELPLQVASIQRRLWSSLMDVVVVIFATAISGYVSVKILPALNWEMPVVGAAVAAPVVFWVAYQLMFILYAARTPGMAVARLAFSTFEGTAPSRRQRRRRLMGVAVSCSSLMLGFFWALFDEDTLCWHDRMSRTYTFQQKA